MKFIIPILVSIILSVTSFAQQVETLVPGPSTFNDGLAVDMYGNIYASEYYGQTVTKITPDGETSIFVSGLDSPNGLAFGPDGFLYIPNVGTNQVFRVDTTGAKSVFTTIPQPSVVHFIDETTMMAGSYTSNSIYTVNLNGESSLWHSGSPLNGPIGILNDDSGYLYISNFTDGKIFRVDSSKNFEQIADLPGWLGFMTMVGENIYASAYNRNRIYKIPVDGSGATVFAGSGASGGIDGPLLEATFNTPNGITTSLTGDTLFISQYNTRSLRMITGMLTPTSIHDKNDAPQRFSLKPNYPNPFNPETNISFSIPTAEIVKITIFDTLGQQVSVLTNREYQAGTHDIKFHGSHLTSGIYYYQITAGEFNQVRKMMLLK
ncbi:MAG: hypothetical protein SCALA702_32060 [Melioribacteraceae bacterium]|nr:MAG: hypothetical protein SCALA702_32060 [Melioribacteraceae bacterium]